MIGPTGCGKTEISRRLAKLADAPFIKVEATKFTEVGYVGRDVEQIARDLVEEADAAGEGTPPRSRSRTRPRMPRWQRLLDALTGKGASDRDARGVQASASADGHARCDAEIEIEA